MIRIAALRHRALTPSSALFMLLVGLSGNVALSQSPDTRFLGVEEWVGLLSIRATASGEISTDLWNTSYSINRHLNYPFTLVPSFVGSGTWITCDVSQSRGTVDDLIVTRYNPSGCEQTIQQSVSSPLETPPTLPLPGQPECVLHGFQLQILALPEAGTYTSWGFFDTIEGEQTTTSGGGGNCVSSSITNEWTTGFLPGDARPICQGTDCLTLPEEGFHIVQNWSFDTLETTNAPRVSVHYDVRLELIGCGEDPEVVVEPIDYDAWRPTAGESEDEPGTTS